MGYFSDDITRAERDTENAKAAIEHAYDELRWAEKHARAMREFQAGIDRELADASPAYGHEGPVDWRTFEEEVEDLFYRYGFDDLDECVEATVKEYYEDLGWEEPKPKAPFYADVDDEAWACRY